MKVLVVCLVGENLELFMREMKDGAFNQKQIDDALEAIYFVGIAEDLAWTKGEGVLREDLKIEDTLLNYLKQGIIIEKGSKTRPSYAIFLLGKQGQLVFEELQQLKNKDPVFQTFLKEFAQLNPKLLFLLDYSRPTYTPLKCLSKDDDGRDFFDFATKFDVIVQMSTKGSKIKDLFDVSRHQFIELIEKYGFYYDISRFQSNKRWYSKSRFINRNPISQILIDNCKMFDAKFGNIVEKLKIFQLLSQSIDTPNLRENLGSLEYECEDIIKRIAPKGITTSYTKANPLRFKIYRPDDFRRELRSLIDERVAPIYEYLFEFHTNGQKGAQKGISLDASQEDKDPITILDVSFMVEGKRVPKLDIDKPSHQINVRIRNITEKPLDVKIRLEMPSVNKEYNVPIISIKGNSEFNTNIIISDPKIEGPHDFKIIITDEKDHHLGTAEGKITISRSFKKKVTEIIWHFVPIFGNLLSPR